MSGHSLRKIAEILQQRPIGSDRKVWRSRCGTFLVRLDRGSRHRKAVFSISVRSPSLPSKWIRVQSCPDLGAAAKEVDRLMTNKAERILLGTDS